MDPILFLTKSWMPYMSELKPSDSKHARQTRFNKCDLLALFHSSTFLALEQSYETLDFFTLASRNFPQLHLRAISAI